MSVYLRVRDLAKTYALRRGLFGRSHPLQAVRGVSFDIETGATFGLVGESGSGKSTIARMLMLAEPPTAGTMEIAGQDIARLSGADVARFRREVQPVLQDPYSSLDPRMRIGRIVAEPQRIHRLSSGRALDDRVAELLERVGLSADTVRRFPHELSGGQRQRVSIARALGLDPLCMILDEPVSALDVSIQAQVLNLLHDLQARLALTYLLISHDLAVVAHLSRRIGVLYLGRFVEVGDTDDIVRRARHPYTQALIASVDDRAARTGPRHAIEGEIPSPMSPPTGCAFHPRCPFVRDRCRIEEPALRELAPRQVVACHFAEEIPTRAPLAHDRPIDNRAALTAAV